MIYGTVKANILAREQRTLEFLNRGLIYDSVELEELLQNGENIFLNPVLPAMLQQKYRKPHMDTF